VTRSATAQVRRAVPGQAASSRGDASLHLPAGLLTHCVRSCPSAGTWVARTTHDIRPENAKKHDCDLWDILGVSLKAAHPGPDLDCASPRGKRVRTGAPCGCLPYSCRSQKRSGKNVHARAMMSHCFARLEYSELRIPRAGVPVQTRAYGRTTTPRVLTGTGRPELRSNHQRS
jgi:hypothetical protein